MKQKLSKLQTNLTFLVNNFLQLAEQLSKAKKDLESNFIPPSPALVEQIVSEQRQFAELRTQALELAQSLEIIIPDIDNIISLKELENILKRIAEAEQTVSEANSNALEILENIFQICYSDRNDFPPLQKCIIQARELHNLILNWQESSVHPEVKTLISGEHPFVQLLTLISERESPDYQQLETLQATVAQSFGMPIAIAALTGKLIFSSAAQSLIVEKPESILEVIEEPETIAQEIAELETTTSEIVDRDTFIAYNIDAIAQEIEELKTKTIEVTDSDTSSEIEATPIQTQTPIQYQADVNLKTQTDAQEIATSLLNSNIAESQNALQYLIWQLIYEDKISLAFNLERCLEIEFPHIESRLPSWIIRAVIFCGLI